MTSALCGQTAFSAASCCIQEIYASICTFAPNASTTLELERFERIDQLADDDTFEESDANLTSSDPLHFTDTDNYPNRQKEASRKSGLIEAVVTGTCKIKTYDAALGIMDFGHFGGSMGSVVGEKVTRITERAQRDNLPLIIVSSSGGARMQEGIFSLMQLAKTSFSLEIVSKMLVDCTSQS